MVANAGTMPRDERTEGWDRWVVALLAWAAGFTDAAGYLLLAHLFTAHMSGNTVAAGESLGSGDWAEAARRAFPIPCFVVGVVAGRVLTENDGADESARSSFANATVLAVEAAALAGAIGIGIAAPFFGEATGRGVGWPDFLCAALLAFAMGIQNLALRRPNGGSATRTTYISGTLTQFLEEVVSLLLARFRSEGKSVPSAEASPNVWLHGGIYAGYFAGAILSGAIVTLLRPSPWWALVLPLIALVGLAVRARNAQHTTERRS